MVLPSAIAAAVSVKAVSPQERASSNAGPHNLPAVATLQYGCMCVAMCAWRMDAAGLFRGQRCELDYVQHQQNRSVPS